MLACVLVLAASPATVAAAPFAGTTDSPSALYSRRVWQSGDGLPEDLAQAIAQTPEGYLWIGTSGGLVRFDGLQFTAFNHANEPAFRDDSVYSLLTTANGTLWAGTEGGGLIRYQGRSFRAFGAKEGLTNAFVRVIFEDRDGTLWVGTDSGLFRMQGEAFTRVDGASGIPAINVHAICQDRSGRLLFGGAGLLALEGGVATYYSSSESFADNSIRTIRETSDGALWIGTISGLRRLEHGFRGDPFGMAKLMDGVNVCFLRETRRGDLWIGTYGRGVMRLSAGKRLTLRAPSPLPQDNVLAIFEDTEENVWVGTQGGLLRLSPAMANTITTASGAPLSINTIYEDPKGALFVAALDGRLYHVAGQALVPTPLPAAVATLPIRNAFRDSAGRLWLGTDGQGVARLDGSDVVRYTMKDGRDFVRAFCEDRDGAIWIGSDGGLTRWRSGAFHTTTGLVYQSVRRLLLDRRGDLWIGTDGGISRFHGGEPAPEPLLDPLRGQKVWALYEDADGGLWIGTQGAGLFLLKGGTLRQFTMEQGLPNNKIYFIAEDEHQRLWMSSPSGVLSVSRLDLETLPRGSPGQLPVRVYGTPEGLTTNQMTGGVQPAGVLRSTGELWLPSTKGAVRIVPDSPDRSRPPSVLVEQVVADDRAVPFANPIRLPPGRGKLELHYTSIRLGSPERVRFRYWMEGFEQNWTAAGQRRVAYFTNLPSGRYRFHVAAYETDAPRKASEQVLVVELQPHFYQTRWFLALCIATAMSLAWGSYRLHVRSIHRQFTAVLNERSRLAREMHDTLIQGCVGVSTLLEAAAQAQDVSPGMSDDLLDRARAEIQGTVDEARLAVWNLRHDSSHDASVVPEVSQLAYRLGHEADVRVRVTTAGAPLAVSDDARHNLLVLVREALQNAIRHGAPSHVSVGLRFARRKLHVAIEDDGCGFDSSSPNSGDEYHYGLIGMRERVEAAGGEFRIISAPGEGTKVHFTIPATWSADARSTGRA